MKLLVVLGEGGHSTELLNLVDLLGGNFKYHYLVSKEDNLSSDRIKIQGTVSKIIRPRGKNTGLLSAFFRTLICAVNAAWILTSVRPAAILSTGPAIAVPVSVLGKLFGAQIIFVETGSRISSLSWTGRILYPWADLFFVQWPQLTERFPRAIFAGRLI